MYFGMGHITFMWSLPNASNITNQYKSAETQID